MKYALLSADQMRAAERFMASRGMESFTLMQNAGEAVAAYAMARYPDCPMLVITGPGNNGGDGFIAAQSLLAQGRAVEVASLVPVSALKGDAARAAEKYKGRVITLAQAKLKSDMVIIDALFGTGLTRKVEGDVAAFLRSINERHMEVIAVDIPSGIESDTGAILGVALKASVTLTFARKKYAHTLLPGRTLCGEIAIADIGISDEAVASAKPNVFENRADYWQGRMRWPTPDHHKYHRGNTLVAGGAPKRSGAAKLAALAALRAGSGLVTIVCDKKDLPVYAGSALSLMTETSDHWASLLKDERRNTVLIGPGAGITPKTRARVLAAFKAKKNMVLDADALTSFATAPKTLFSAIKSPCIMTPHDGEFARLFPKLTGSKIEKALKAAALSKAVILLKGYDTVIAAPDGRASVNTNAPPDLATAGAGDVLAGICAGLLAQGMDAFDAACAAVWIHGACAREGGAGLIAEDLISFLPLVLQNLRESV